MERCFERVRAIGFQAERIACGPYGSGRKSAADLGRFLARDAATGVADAPHGAAHRMPMLVYLNGPRLLPAAALAEPGCPVLFHSHSYLGSGAVRDMAAFGLRSTGARLVAQCEFVAAPWRPFVRPEHISVIYNGVAGPPRALPRPPAGPPRVRVHRPHRSGKGTARIRRRRRTHSPGAAGMPLHNLWRPPVRRKRGRAIRSASAHRSRGIACGVRGMGRTTSIPAWRNWTCCWCPRPGMKPPRA